MHAALLLLADSRLPAGGHAHSGSLAIAVAEGLVVDLGTLESFCSGRLATAGALAAVFAARAAQVAESGGTWTGGLADLDAALDARMPAAAARAASRSLGRGLIRVARSAWPSTLVEHAPRQPHHSLALGVVTVAAGGTVGDAALLAATSAVSASCSAAVRLLGLDPFAVTDLQSTLAQQIDQVADAALRWMHVDAASLPAPSAPHLELLAQRHQRSEVRLFAS
ncbi:MAG: urease accessory protein UreF [Candidatus Nanopelagicales bacterium]